MNEIDLINELVKLPTEKEWLEFKRNYFDPEETGEYISALSNSAAIHRRPNSYLIWGIENNTHEIVGTSFKPSNEKVGNEELENWLLRHLSPKINFSFSEIIVDNKLIVLLTIDAAYRHPVRFKSDEYLRIGTYKKKLKDYPEKERALWRILDETPFELRIATESISSGKVLDLIDYPSFFGLLEKRLPESRDSILEALKSYNMISKHDSGGWNILNLGAILFAKKLSDFDRLKRKSIRVILYSGDGRIKTVWEKEGIKGYANGFEGLIEFINNILPKNEIIQQALRKTVPMYPELAIRELVANALIHQDYFVTGSGPKIEIFENRIEITNPGKPLVAVERFLDSPPISRNERLAHFMRLIGVCEERGSGIDKVVLESEYYQLPAPDFKISENNTIAVLFSHRPVSKMDKTDKIRSCYLHSCLKYVTHDYMTNSSLRKRFGIAKENSAIVSRIINETVKVELVKQYEPTASRRYVKYVPFWA